MLVRTYQDDQCWLSAKRGDTWVCELRYNGYRKCYYEFLTVKRKTNGYTEMTNGVRINRWGISYSDDKKGDCNRSRESYSYIHCFPLTRDRKAEVEKCNEERRLYQK